ncbi:MULTISPECIES: hypothetical protein [unclassified Streptomyces]|uniref:hypothetical protein n=1 Tax=unclassified Streptomyces TaxID=2593676 RepID=UPI0033B15C34
MTDPSIDAHVHLDTHPSHPSAVTATVTGPDSQVAATALLADGWETVAGNTLVLARISHQESQ